MQFHLCHPAYMCIRIRMRSESAQRNSYICIRNVRMHCEYKCMSYADVLRMYTYELRWCIANAYIWVALMYCECICMRYADVLRNICMSDADVLRNICMSYADVLRNICMSYADVLRMHMYELLCMSYAECTCAYVWVTRIWVMLRDSYAPSKSTPRNQNSLGQARPESTVWTVTSGRGGNMSYAAYRCTRNMCNIICKYTRISVDFCAGAFMCIYVHPYKCSRILL